ncbi:hypothetical protein HYX08_00450 [Candidatus Woesearchaeota archaeon]|nr:hypothetical protein [Candidatus Woesearchaeota archaeon]
METEEIKNTIDNHEERLKKIEAILFEGGQSSNQKTIRNISISEFVIQKKPKDDIQRTVLFAYFIEKHENKDFFNAGEIQECFIKSKSTKPANINDKINQCIKKGWISEHPEKKDGKKAFYITNTGIAVVEKDFKVEE